MAGCKARAANRRKSLATKRPPSGQPCPQTEHTMDRQRRSDGGKRPVYGALRAGMVATSKASKGRVYTQNLGEGVCGPLANPSPFSMPSQFSRFIFLILPIGSSLKVGSRGISVMVFGARY